MFATRTGTLLTALALVVPAARAAAQDVFVVDGGGGLGVDFTNLGAAVSAAGEGDTLLIHAGSYATLLTIDARSLSLVADPQGADVELYGALTVEHLSSDQFVSLRGIKVTGDGNYGLQAVHVLDNLGSVWIEDCMITGPAVSTFLDPPGPGLVADDSAHVVLVRCNVHGNAGAGALYPHGRAAITMSSSNLRIFDSTLSGGGNGCSNGCPSDTSAPGVFVDGGTLLVEGSEISAGDGGLFCPFGPPFCLPGPTGPCIWLKSNSPSLFLFDSTFPYGNPAVDIDSGSATTPPGTSRDFAVGSPVRVGETLTLDFAGSAGDKLLVLAGAAPADVLKPALSGALLVGSPSSLFALGSLPASGTLALTATAPSFAPAFESVALVLQAAFVPSAGGVILSDPARLVLLNRGF